MKEMLEMLAKAKTKSEIEAVMTYDEAKARCKQCYYYSPWSTTWRWPCMSCSGAPAIFESVKDYFTPGRHIRRYCVEFTDCGCGKTKTAIVWGRTEQEVLNKFHHAYSHLPYVVNAVYEKNETEG